MNPYDPDPLFVPEDERRRSWALVYILTVVMVAGLAVAAFLAYQALR